MNVKVVVTLNILVVVLMLGCSPTHGATTELVSLDVNGHPGDVRSRFSSVSGDGRFVAFDSSASLLPEDTASGSLGDDIYVLDRLTNTLELISKNINGLPTKERDQYPSISSDGRYVAFWSYANDFVPNDTNGAVDIFVHDRETGVTERVSVASDGAESNFDSETPSISGDGRFVAFHSLADNLVPGDTNDAVDVFVFDRETKLIDRVSVASDGAQANSRSFYPDISSDGRYVVFSSDATNIDARVTDRKTLAYIHDRILGTTELISEVTSHAVISAKVNRDGRFVAFTSNSRSFLPEDTNRAWDIFVFDRHTNVTERVSVASDGTQGNARTGIYYYDFDISDDGDHVVFGGLATNLVEGDNNGVPDIFVHNRISRETARISVNSNGVESDAGSGFPSISGDGRFITFASHGLNLADNLTGALEVYVHDSGPDNEPPVADAGVDRVVECAGGGASITLDASFSTDPDSETLSYSWEGPFGSATGMTAGVTLDLGVHTIYLTVDDGNGGIATDEMIVTVRDTTPPRIEAGSDITLEAVSTLGAPYVVAYNALDTCGAVSVTIRPTPEYYPLGSTTVQVIARDESGNEATDNMVIVVHDTTSPIVIAPPSVIVDATAPLTDVDLDPPGQASAMDTVDGVLTPTPDVTGPFDVGVHVITWSATDSSGNTGTATQTVTINNVAPTVSVSAPTGVLEGDTVAFLLEFVDPDATLLSVQIDFGDGNVERERRIVRRDERYSAGGVNTKSSISTRRGISN